MAVNFVAAHQNWNMIYFQGSPSIMNKHISWQLKSLSRTRRFIQQYIGPRGRLPVFVSEYLRDRWIRVRIGTTLSDEFYPEEGVPTGGVLAVTCFGLKINELPSCIAKDIFKALFVGDLAICFRGRSLDTIETYTAGSECHRGMGDKEWLQVCSPQVQSHTFHCTAVSGSETPHCEDWKHTSASGGVHEIPWAVVGLAPVI